MSTTLVSIEETNEYLLERLILDLNGIEEVPALFIKPRDKKGRLPAILYNHSHSSDYTRGKDELLDGSESLQKPSYAHSLTSQGYAVLCIDMWAFGERSFRSESELFKYMLWEGQVLWGMMVYDTLRAVDFLLDRGDVEPSRLGIMGMSMGSTMAWWTAALEPRIKVCIDICCLTDFHALIETRGLDLHGFYYYVPGLLKHFTAAQINALIAPRPHLSLVGKYDPLTPPSGLKRIDMELREVYGSYDALDAWQLVCYDTGHFETEMMRRDVLRFFRKWL
jgi:dienelactone hydrolase